MTTFHDIQKAVRTIAAETPDFNYSNQDGMNPQGDPIPCSYRGMHIDAPSRGRGCIFGEAFKALGVDSDTLTEYDRIGPIASVIDEKYSDIPAIESAWSLDVQNHQDTGYTWGAALKLADQRYPSVLASFNESV